MKALTTVASDERDYRRILGVRFFVGDAPAAVEVGAKGGLVVAPAAPALVDLACDREYREALLESDLAITDSGFLVLLWNAMTWDNIRRVSGLEYLKLLLVRSEFHQPGAVLWVMPSLLSRERNLRWLQGEGFPVGKEDCYLAPQYPHGAITDESLVALINQRRPRHVVIAIGGGVQERLGLHLKRRCLFRPAIHCVGAAVGFLTGDQVHIPDWADKWILGWLFRCVSNPSRFLPRYCKALKLPFVLWRYRNKMPKLQVATDGN